MIDVFKVLKYPVYKVSKKWGILNTPLMETDKKRHEEDLQRQSVKAKEDESRFSAVTTIFGDAMSDKFINYLNTPVDLFDPDSKTYLDIAFDELDYEEIKNLPEDFNTSLSDEDKFMQSLFYIYYDCALFPELKEYRDDKTSVVPYDHIRNFIYGTHIVPNLLFLYRDIETRYPDAVNLYKTEFEESEFKPDTEKYICNMLSVIPDDKSANKVFLAYTIHKILLTCINTEKTFYLDVLDDEDAIYNFVDSIQDELDYSGLAMPSWTTINNRPNMQQLNRFNFIVYLILMHNNADFTKLSADELDILCKPTRLKMIEYENKHHALYVLLSGIELEVK